MDPKRRTRSYKSLGEILVEMGQVSPEALAKAQGEGANDRDTVATLTRMGLVTPEDVARALATRHGLTYVDLENVTIPPNVRLAVDRKQQLAQDLVPIELTETSITICVSDPSNLQVKLDLEARTGKSVRVVVSTVERVRAAIRGKSHGIRDQAAEKPKTVELNLECMWKLFDGEDRPKSEVVYGGKVRQIAKEGCTIEGTLPTGDELRQLTFRKYVMKLNIFLTGRSEPVRAIGHLRSRSTTEETAQQRYEVSFTRLADGDTNRLEEWLSSL